MKTLQLPKLMTLILAGPVLLLVTFLSGADLFDGLFGVKRNNDLQNLGLNGGYIITILGWIAALVLTLKITTEHWKSNKRYALTVLLPLGTPFVIIFLFDLAGLI